MSKTIRFALFALYFFSGVQNVVTIFSISFVIFFLLKLKFGNVDAIEAAKLLKEANSISNDVILVSDEMYLQKKVQYFCGRYVSADSNGNIHKGIVFMMQGLKKICANCYQACPETMINGKWLAEILSNCIAMLSNADFKVRGVVCDNHAANVSALIF